MDKLQCMEAFVRVAQSGSFIQAAESLGGPQIQRLKQQEIQIGVRG
ncbi:hypothetical protein ABTJ07_07975 [Acinetobacter baumannii]